MKDKSIQTDLNPMMDIINNSTLFYDYIGRPEQLIDFTGLWAMYL
jgi:hypothetical protein